MYQTDPIETAVASGSHADAVEAIREIDSRLGSSTNAKSRANLLLNKAVFLGILGRFEETAPQLQLALQTAPDDEGIRVQAEYIEGVICHNAQRYEEAYERLSAVLIKFTTFLERSELRVIFEDIQVRRGFELVQLLRFDEALPLLHEILSFALKPEDRNTAIFYLGICYLKLGDYDNAVQYLRDALERALSTDCEGQAHCQLGIAYAHLNLLPQAKNELEICLEHIDEYQLPRRIVYGWLSRVYRALGNRSEADRYAQLSQPS